MGKSFDLCELSFPKYQFWSKATRDSLFELTSKQECIPVGCVPTASIATIGSGGVCLICGGKHGNKVRQKVIQEGQSQRECHVKRP